MNQIPVHPLVPASTDADAAHRRARRALDARFMKAALAAGRRALPACLPNPPVGCVLVRGGRIVATGFTQPPWKPHAEAMALSALAGDGHDVTAYVTLEPCAFHGRTPSCARALVARGIGRVVVATLDPDPRNDGAGIALLREAGIAVEVGLGERQALADLGPYLWRRSRGAAGDPTPRRPGDEPPCPTCPGPQAAPDGIALVSARRPAPGLSPSARSGRPTSRY